MRIRNKCLPLLFLFALLSSSLGLAGAGITYHGKLLNASGVPVTSSSVSFKIQIRSSGSENCLMYEEVQTKDLSSSQGVFSITINDGTGTRLDSTGYGLDRIFANRGSFSFANGLCAVGNIYSPGASDGRKMQVLFNDGTFPSGQWEPGPALAINFAPASIEALQVGGYKKEQLLKLADGVSTTGSELNATQWSQFLALLDGSSNTYIKSTDPITQLQGASLPTPTNGQSIRWNGTLNSGSGGWENYTPASSSTSGTVTSITAGTGLSVGAGPGGSITASGTLNIDVGTSAGKIVQVQAGGKLPALDGSSLTNLTAANLIGTIGGTTSINTSGSIQTSSTIVATGNIQTSSDLTSNRHFFYDHSGVGPGYVGIQAPANIAGSGGANYILTLPNAPGTNGQMITTNGSGTLSWSTPPVGLPATTGTAAAPSYAFIGDTDTGMFSATANTLGFSTSGSERMTINSSGNVGIGTTNPISPLHIVSTSNSIISLQNTFSNGFAAVDFYDHLGTKSAGFGWGNSGTGIPFRTAFYLNTNSTNPIVLMTNDTERLRVDGTGNVGIGAASPGQKLAVIGDSAVSGYLRLGSTSAPNNTTAGDLTVGRLFVGNASITTSSGAISGVQSYSTNVGGMSMGTFANNTNGSAIYGFKSRSTTFGNWTVPVVSGDDVASFFAEAADGASLIRGASYKIQVDGAVTTGIVPMRHTWYTQSSSGTLAERMRINSSGNVGIGTTSPASKLVVTTDSTVAGDSNATVTIDSANNTNSFSLLLRAKTGAGTVANVMAVLGDGNVGIGTITPSYKLDVNGDVNIASANALRFGETSVCTSTGCTSSSDIRLKENIVSLDNSLEKILQLRGVEYDYIDKARFGDSHQIGVIAQEIEKIYPEVVKTDSKTGLKAVAYDHLVAPLIEAVKTLYAQITNAEDQLTNQAREIASIKDSKADTVEIEVLKTENAQLRARADKAENENAAIKTYLCTKDPNAPFCLQ